MIKLLQILAPGIMAMALLTSCASKDRLVVRSNGGFLEHCFIDTIHILEKPKKDVED
jgi:hypothetical protein